MKSLVTIVIFGFLIFCRASASPVSIDDLAVAKQAADKIANLIYQRFEFHNKDWFQFFMGASNMPDYAWDILKYKICKKAVDGNATFLLIFGGSSVTAGHDNYYNQSYPLVFERRLKPVFKSIGIELVVHNIAQGANNCRPSGLCYEAMGGENADLIGKEFPDPVGTTIHCFASTGWEQSFNCGKARDIFELIARVAYWSKGVAYYSASGAFLPTGCAPSTDPIPWTSEEWTPEKEKPGVIKVPPYNMTPENVAEHKKEQNEWYLDGNSVGRFTGVYGTLYKGVGPHGFSVWGHASHKCINGTGCTAIDKKGECHEKGGPHWMVQETAWYGQDSKLGKQWHPSAGMHLLRGEVLAYNMVNIFADAIFTLQKDLQKHTHSQLSKMYELELSKLQVPMPEKALYCYPEECAQKPMCYTDFEPHYNPKQLLKGLVLPSKKQSTNSSNPSATVAATVADAGDVLDGWTVIRKNGQGAADDPKYGHMDKRIVYVSQRPGAEIHFMVIGVRAQAVRVCGYPHKESLKFALFYLDPNVTISEQDRHRPYVPSDKQFQITNIKLLSDECTQLQNIPLGNSVLTVKADPKHPSHSAHITHIIVL